MKTVCMWFYNDMKFGVLKENTTFTTVATFTITMHTVTWYVSSFYKFEKVNRPEKWYHFNLQNRCFFV